LGGYTSHRGEGRGINRDVAPKTRNGMSYGRWLVGEGFQVEGYLQNLLTFNSSKLSTLH
jgi:hypothetical protein